MDFRIAGRLAALLLVFGAAAAYADEAARIKVDMPPEAASALREEMLMKLQSIHQVEAALAAGKPAEAADFVERHLGMSAMGQHAALAPTSRPGRYLPEAMLALGRQSHGLGSELATALKSSDRPRIDATMRDLTATCVNCHANYRLH